MTQEGKMQSYQRLQDTAQTETTIREIARKARTTNSAVVAHLKATGHPLQFTVRQQAS